MSTFSDTSTYTIADVAKVVDRFAADLHMLSQATGLLTRELVSSIVHDVKLKAQRGYVDRVDVILQDPRGTTLRAASYMSTTDASGWTSDRPGNNMWPRSPGGSLSVVVFNTAAWWSLTDAQRQAFVYNQCLLSWTASQIDTSYSGMVGSADRRYASNAYGFQRTTYGG